jgi:putative oxygen-independent coproporphyrinogen III oxidase
LLLRSEIGIYIHVPFCVTRCGYCDFNTYTPGELAQADSNESWMNALLSEIDLSMSTLGNKSLVNSIFLGGGTPSLLSAKIIKSIFNKLSINFEFSKNIEITIEANPDTVSEHIVQAWLDAGINRVSIGMQSADLNVLKTLDRTHNPNNVKKAVDVIKKIGISNFSLDLIYGTPGEDLESWNKTLAAALALQPPHISAYALTIEPGTALHRRLQTGKIEGTSSDDQADKYLLTDQLLSENGLNWYEISNWSKPGFESQHNLNYWTNRNWWGYGPGAHSHLSGTRWWNVKHPATYSSQLMTEKTAIAESEELTTSQKELEKIMLKMRIRESNLNEFVPADLLAKWRNENLVKNVDDRLELTPQGRLMLDGLIHQLTK